MHEYFLDKSKNYFIILIFFLLAKFPTYELAIRGDLETYILIAHQYLQGNYSALIETKPPFLYLFYISILFLAEDNLYLLNVLGSSIIFIGGLMVYECCENKNKILAPIIYIFSSTYLVSGGIHLTSEHIVVIPILISFYLLRDIKKKNFWKFIIIGFLLSLAVMIRQNMAILYIAITLYLLTCYKKYRS